VPESYTLDDLRRDMHVTESAEAFLCEWGKTPGTAAQADAADASADILVAVRGR
jgi:hypothetical protein